MLFILKQIAAFGCQLICRANHRRVLLLLVINSQLFKVKVLGVMGEHLSGRFSPLADQTELSYGQTKLNKTE